MMARCLELVGRPASRLQESGEHDSVIWLGAIWNVPFVFHLVKNGDCEGALTGSLCTTTLWEGCQLLSPRKWSRPGGKLMKKKVKKTGAISVKVKKRGPVSTAREESTPTRLRKYLNPTFATQLIEHMHRAKKAALRNKA